MEYYHATMENVKFGVNIGDMFNALASFCCLKRKLNDNTTFYFVTHPSRFFLVNLFSKYGAVPIEYDKCKDKHIKSLWINSTGFLNYVRKEYNREMIYWDYFERFNLTSDDLISFYETIIPNKIENNIIGKNDIILCPMTNGGDIIDNTLFINYINKLKETKRINEIYVNIEKDVKYRNQHIDQYKQLETTLEEFLSLSYYNNPIILGLRSGLFDILYGLNIHQPIHVFCNNKCGCQMNWRYSIASSRYDKMKQWKSNITELVI